jgi:lipopolysaccharide exporter
MNAAMFERALAGESPRDGQPEALAPQTLLGAGPAAAGQASGSEPSLVSMLLRGVTWTGAARLVSSVGYAVRYVVFARLLTPFDFGVAGSALFSLRLLTALTGTGFGNALVNQKEEIEPYLDTVWVSELSRGILLAGLMMFAARPLARFFREEEAYLVFFAVAPLALLRLCQSPAMASLYRRMEFHITLVLNSAELLIGFAVGLAAISYWRDWRGLVAATLARQAARMALSYWYFPYGPRLRVTLSRARRMFSFGRWIAGARLADFAALQLDNLVVAHLLGPRSLGEYQMAFRLGEMPTSELAESFSIVSFPLVSKLGERRSSCDRLFVLINAALALIGIIYTVLLLEWDAALIGVGLGSSWFGALAPLRLLCLCGVFGGSLNVGKSFLDGLGEPASSFLVALLRAGTLAIVVYPLTAGYGTTGAALSALISVIAPLPLMMAMYWRAQ